MHPISGPELLQHVLNVALDGELTQVNVLGNLRVGEPFGDQPQDRSLPLSQRLAPLDTALALAGARSESMGQRIIKTGRPAGAPEGRRKNAAAIVIRPPRATTLPKTGIKVSAIGMGLKTKKMPNNELNDAQDKTSPAVTP